MGGKTHDNLYVAFVGEAKAHHRLLAFARKAEEEGERAAVLTFSQARDVEEGHAALYKRALSAMLRDETHGYYVCQVCGYVAEREPPDQCPVCGAKRGQFRLVT